MDRGKCNIPNNHRSESFDHELRLGPSHNPLLVFVALANDQYSPLFLTHVTDSYKVECEVSRHRPTLNSPAHDDVGGVNSGKTQPNEIDE